MVISFILIAAHAAVAIAKKHLFHSPDALHHVASRQFEIYKHKKFSAGDIQNISIINQEDILYYINVSIGTPHQYFQLQLDSGSSILWVGANNCNSCPNRNLFDPHRSSSYHDLGVQYTQKYGFGQCAGVYGTETLSLPNTNISVTMKILFVESTLNFKANFQGIMGLSNWLEHQNVFDLGYAAGELKTPLFAIQVRQAPKTSYVYFDQFNPEVFENTVWIPTNSEYRWSLRIYGLYVNDVDLTEFLEGSGLDGLMDSGASCLWLDERIVSYLWKEHFSKLCVGENHCPCESDAYPILRFYFGGAKINVEADNYLFRLRDSCYPCFHPIKTGELSVLGAPVMQEYIALLDKSNQQIGLYKVKTLTDVGWFAIPLLVLTGLVLLLCLIFAIILMRTKLD